MRGAGSDDSQCRESFAEKIILLVYPSSKSRKAIYEKLFHLGARLWCVNEAVDDYFTDVIEKWIILPAGSQSVEASKQFVLGDLSKTGDKLDAILTYDEFGVVLASHLQAALNLPGVPVWMAETCRDKTKFRDACTSKGIPSVRYQNIPAHVGPSAISLAFPLVFKPRHGAGSHFVRRVESASELRTAWEASLQTLRTNMLPAYSPWVRGDGSECFFVEEVLDGPEVDVDCVVQNGHLTYMSVSDNFPSTRPPYFMEAGGLMPSRLPEAQQDQIKMVVRRMVEAFSAHTSPSLLSAVLHVEMKCAAVVTPHILVPLSTQLLKAGPAPIEMNLRLGGAETRTLNMAARGIDLGLEAALLALGEQPISATQACNPKCYAASVNFLPPSSGVISHLNVPEEVTSDAAYEAHALFLRTGDTIMIPPDGFQYAGWLVVKGESAEDATRQLDSCIDRCDLRVHPSQEKPEDGTK